MSILAPIGLLIVLLTVGFRYSWGLSAMILLGSSIFAILLGLSSIEEIKANWESRRCDWDVLLTSQFYKPSDDPRSGGEFASENFTFCVRGILVSVITMVLTPIYSLLNQQLNVTESLNEAFNKIRMVQATFLKGFERILDPFFKRFKGAGQEFGITYHKLLSAMGRAFGITQAILYLGMSMVLAVENFVHFVINVIMIILYIILGLMVLLFFMILPVFGVIIYTCQMIGNSPFGYLSKDVCGELCFDPATRVRLQDSRVLSIKNCRIGDVFEDGTRIDGILHVKGDKEAMFSLDGIRVSGAHLIWFEETQEWIPVAQHPRASLSMQPSPLLICLRTSTRNIPLQGLTRTWTFRDWEELPLNLPSSDTIWDFLVSEILNEREPQSPTPTEIPLLKPTCEVLYQTGERRYISEVQIGDTIYCSKGFTKVTGIYKGEARFGKESPLTDGIWMQSLGQSDWNHPSEPSTGHPEAGFHLTTESGCFWIQTKNLSGFVRDFTEVGAHDLSLTYRYTRQLLKKSFTREESCVSDSLSQVLSSYSQPIY